MTQNQIAFYRARNEAQNYRATQALRSAELDETRLSHRNTEAEQFRSNQARELENYRSNTAREAETARANRANEALNRQKNLITLGYNQASLAEQKRSNLARESETHRANTAQEAIAKTKNLNDFNVASYRAETDRKIGKFTAEANATTNAFNADTNRALALNTINVSGSVAERNYADAASKWASAEFAGTDRNIALIGAMNGIAKNLATIGSQGGNYYGTQTINPYPEGSGSYEVFNP